MAKLNNCPHCGSETEFMVNTQGVIETVLAQCTNCKIQTQPLASSLDYSAKDKIAELWNAHSGEEWPDWTMPSPGTPGYSKGAKASHIGKKWVSNVDNNVWEPGVACWTEYKGGAA